MRGENVCFVSVFTQLRHPAPHFTKSGTDHCICVIGCFWGGALAMHSNRDTFNLLVPPPPPKGYVAAKRRQAARAATPTHKRPAYSPLLNSRSELLSPAQLRTAEALGGQLSRLVPTPDFKRRLQPEALGLLTRAISVPVLEPPGSRERPLPPPDLLQRWTWLGNQPTEAETRRGLALVGRVERGYVLSAEEFAELQQHAAAARVPATITPAVDTAWPAVGPPAATTTAVAAVATPPPAPAPVEAPEQERREEDKKQCVVVTPLAAFMSVGDAPPTPPTSQELVRLFGRGSSGRLLDAQERSREEERAQWALCCKLA